MDDFYGDIYIRKATCEQQLIDQLQTHVMYILIGCGILLILVTLFWNASKVEELESRLTKREMFDDLQRQLIKHV